MNESLKQHLKAEEGVKRSAYQDHLGYWTIGVGRLIDERKGGKLSDAEIDMLLENDVLNCEADLDRNVDGWRRYPDRVQTALLSMCFQLGWPTLKTFSNMLGALRDGDYASAAEHALRSKWAREDTPARAVRVAQMMRNA